MIWTYPCPDHLVGSVLCCSFSPHDCCRRTSHRLIHHNKTLRSGQGLTDCLAYHHTSDMFSCWHLSSVSVHIHCDPLSTDHSDHSHLVVLHYHSHPADPGAERSAGIGFGIVVGLGTEVGVVEGSIEAAAVAAVVEGSVLHLCFLDLLFPLLFLLCFLHLPLLFPLCCLCWYQLCCLKLLPYYSA